MGRRDGNAASTEAMRSYWDERARENALWFIQSTQHYAGPDREAFWRSGEEVLDTTLGLFDLDFRGDERVLDVGCGLGRVTRALARRAGEAVGIDVSNEMILRATTENAGVEGVSFVLGNGRDLGDFPDASFDVCYSFVVFQHIPDPDVTCGYIREMGRVLRPGGWALFHVSEQPDVHSRARYRYAVGWRVRRLLGRGPSGCLDPQWLGSAMRRPMLLRALEDGGFALDATAGEGTQFCLVHAHRV